MSAATPKNIPTGICPRCNQQVEIGQMVGAKIGGAALGAYFGDRATDHWLGVIFGAVLGGAIGHVIDKAVLPVCPTCRLALEILDAMI